MRATLHHCLTCQRLSRWQQVMITYVVVVVVVQVVQVTLLKLVMRSGTLQYEKQAVNLMGRDEPGKRWSKFIPMHYAAIHEN